MKNFSVITDIRLALFRHNCIPVGGFTRIKLSEILMPGYSFEVISGVKPLSCSFEESEKKTDAGTYFEKKLKFELSKLRPEVTDCLNRYAGNRVMALITDANGYSWLVFPLIRTLKRELPGTARGANVTEVTFTGNDIWESPSVEIDL